MAKGRTRSRMDLRAEAEAVEARQREARKDGAEGDDDDLGELDTGDAEAPEAEEAEEGVKVKKPAKKKKATETKPRKKAVKLVRKRVVWVVYDNSNKKQGQSFDYPNKADAEALAEKLRTEKKGTFFVQPVKEEMPAE